MIRVSAIAAAAALLAQPALACRAGGSAILFETAPDQPPADLTMVHGRFRSTGPIEIAVNAKTASEKIGDYTQIGFADLDSGETVRVYAVLHSCLQDIWRFNRMAGDYYMVGRLQGEPGKRELLVADRFPGDGVRDAIWTSRQPD